MKKNSWYLKLLHRFFRLSKFQQFFVVYLIFMLFLFVFFPVVKIIPLDEDAKTKFVFLLSGHFFQTSFIVFLSLIFLLLWNLSVNFKNLVINLFNLKDNETVITFLFLWIIATGYAGIGDTLAFVNKYTSTLKATGVYYFTEIVLLAGLVYTLLQMIKNLKRDRNSASIVNLLEKEPKKGDDIKKIKGLFEEE